MANNPKDKLDKSLGSKNRKKSKNNLRVYSNLSAPMSKRAQLKGDKSRKRAEYLATLPQSRWARIKYYLSPRNFFRFWFSKEGFIMGLKIAGIGVIACVVLVLSVFTYFRKDLALSPDELARKVQSNSTTFYDRTGKIVLWQTFKDQNRTVIPSTDIPQSVKNAAVSIEDKDFYKHGGFDARGIARAVVKDISHGSAKQGASTITQQLVRNAILQDREKTMTRKIKEVVLSIEIERLYSKDQILSFYLNEIPFGGTNYGIQAASKAYFNKDAKKLTLDESATLAAMIQLPTYYSPVGPNKSDLIDRRNIVLRNMLNQGYISNKQYTEAKKTDTLAKVSPTSAKSQYSNIKAPHFVLELEQELEQKYGADNVLNGGWKIITTLDIDLQKVAEQAMKDNVKYVDAAGANNAALVAVDPATAQVVAMVGSRDFNYPGFGQKNAATALLQPGSSVKIFDYAELFKRNDYGPGTTLADTPINFAGYSPHNFDDRYRGNISIRSALAESRNTSAVKAAEMVGVDNVIKLSHDMGDLEYCKNQDCGLSAAIGGGSLRLDQHANAFATLARGGVYKPQTYVLSINDARGKEIYRWKNSDGTKVLDPQIPYLISDILRDPAARMPTFGYGNLLQVNGVPNLAVKTGTTDLFKDNWMMGYSPKLAAGVWAGRSDGLPTNGGNAQDGEIFNQFMRVAHTEVLAKRGKWSINDWFKQPNGIKKISVNGRYDLFQSWYKTPKYVSKNVTVDRVSKMLATDCTPDGARMQVKATGTLDPKKPKETKYFAQGYDLTKKDSVHSCSDEKPTVSNILVTQSGSTYALSAQVINGKYSLGTVEFIVDGQVVASKKVSPSGGTITVNVSAKPGSHSLIVKATDTAYYQSQQSTSFNATSPTTPDTPPSPEPED